MGNGREDPNATVKTAYNNFVREPLRTSARNEVQRFDALEIADKIVEIGHSVGDAGQGTFARTRRTTSSRWW